MHIEIYIYIYIYMYILRALCLLDHADRLVLVQLYLQNLSVFIAHLKSSLSSAFLPVIGAE